MARRRWWAGLLAVAAQAQPRASERVSGARFDGLILAPHARDEWMPTAAQIVALEPALVPALTPTVVVDGRRQPLSAARLATYKRLYVGREHGHAIDVYLYCKLDGWPTRVRWPRGGGACYLRARWDVDRGQVGAVEANSGA